MKLNLLKYITRIVIISITIAIFISFFACKKVDKTTIIKGKVIDPFTQKPIAGASVAIWARGIFSIYEYYFVAETKTNNDGFYSISSNEKIRGVSLNDYFVDTSGYKCSYQCGLDTIQYGKTNIIDFTEFAPISTIIFSLNITKYKFFEKVEVYDEKLKLNWLVSPYWGKSQKDSNLYFTSSAVRANDSILVVITTNKNGIKAKQTFRKYVHAFQTDTIELMY